MPSGERGIGLFLSGDVMTGRGMDQVLPHPGDPRLYEPAITSAEDYVALAERASGPIPRPVDPAYPWGDALEVLAEAAPAARIINLETAVTAHDEAAPKGINYRMHPRNVGVLEAAGIDCCVLANNHVLDWGVPGLLETLDTLARTAIQPAGAGRDHRAAAAPAILVTAAPQRVLVFGFAAPDSGTPRNWAAGVGRPGVHRLDDLSTRSVRRLGRQVRRWKRPGDLAVASIHWGENWGYRVPDTHRRFARELIDGAGIDVVHGHSSHHPRGIEVYRDRLILYGCGDFLNDYEGIPGYEEYRGDLVLMYLPTFEAASGRLLELRMVPFQVHRFRLRRPSTSDRHWLLETLDRECRRFGRRISARGDAFALG